MTILMLQEMKRVMIIFGGLTTNQEVLNNAYQLNLGTLNWRKV